MKVSRFLYAATNYWRFSSEYAEDDTATVYYNYRHYEPVTGRWMQRDPIEEFSDVTLYAWCENSISGFDYIGLACQKQSGAGFSRPYEVQVGAGISVSASFTISGMRWDCCCDGVIKFGDAYDIGITGQVTLGLGVGAHTKLPFIGTVGWTIEGPKYAWDVGAHANKGCGEDDPYVDVTIFEWVGKLGGGGVIGAAFGVSGGYWLNYRVGAHLIIAGGDCSFKVITGTDGGLETSVETPMGNIDWEFFGHDETSEAK